MRTFIELQLMYSQFKSVFHQHLRPRQARYKVHIVAEQCTETAREPKPFGCKITEKNKPIQDLQYVHEATYATRSKINREEIRLHKVCVLRRGKYKNKVNVEWYSNKTSL